LYYYWALAQRGQGKIKEALRNFSLAAYDYAWFSAANYQLAQMERERGNAEQALEYIDDAWSANIRNGNIVVLYSALLREAGRGAEAFEKLERAIRFDPLNYALLHEKFLVTGDSPITEMHDNMQDPENSYIEIATHYLAAGMHGEAIRVLSQVSNPGNPLFQYYKAYALAMDGKETEARDQLALAGTLSYAYVFPYRLLSEKVINYAMEAAPDNAVPVYLLGNLLYEKRAEEAIAAWQQAVEIDKDFAMAWRNLAFGAYYHEEDAGKAIGHLQKALELAPEHPYWYAELVRYYEASGRDPEECLAQLDEHAETAIQDITAAKDLVELYNLTGAYNKAIALLDTHHFRTWEGGRDIYWHFVDAHVLTAIELLKEKSYPEALDHLSRATQYPENLEVGKPLNDERNALIWYYMAQTAEKQGNRKAAKKYYGQCINARNSTAWPDLDYYKALAYRVTGNDKKADELLTRLQLSGNELMNSSAAGRGIGVEESAAGKDLKSLSEGFYLLGLASLGRGDETEAREHFRKAVEINPWNLWAAYQLGEMR